MLDATKLLLAKGADGNKRDSQGNNPAFWARELDHREILKIKELPQPAHATMEEKMAA